MGIVTIGEIKPGMVLESDLYGSNGRFLMPAGAVVDDKHIRVFKIWGVTEIEVKGDGVDGPRGEPESLDAETLARSEAHVERLFALTDPENQAVREFKKLSVLRGARMIHNEEPLPDLTAPEGPAVEPGDDKPPSIGRIMGRQSQLSSNPEIYMRIVEVLDNPRSTAAYIAEVVGKDTGVSAKLLRLVNSPFYGFPTRIDSLSRAVALIGAKELTTLALGISMVNHFKGVPSNSVDMKSFWLHSVACGVLARLFANHKIGLNEERFFVAGLLHDVAKLILFKDIPERMRNVFHTAREQALCQFEAEKEVLGFDHTRLAEALLGEWKLPSPLQRMIRYHHSPRSAAGGLDSAIIHISDAMAIALMYGASGQTLVPPLRPGAWEGLELGAGVIEAVAKQADRQIHEITKVFLG